jgi:hypothetical protein
MHAELQAVTQLTSESTYSFNKLNTKIIGDLARNIAGWGEARKLAGISQRADCRSPAGQERAWEDVRGKARAKRGAADAAQPNPKPDRSLKGHLVTGPVTKTDNGCVKHGLRGSLS